MKMLNPEKLKALPTFNHRINEKYGKIGTASRNKFDDESLAWFYGNMFRNRRRELKLTQRQVAASLGLKQSYIARVERGKADIQLSSFFHIASVLGIRFVPTLIPAPCAQAK